MTAAWPSDDEVIANAKVAYTEVRTQIDHQIRNADAIDTKATAIITAVGVLAALVAPGFHLDTTMRQSAGLVALFLGFVVLVCCFLAIRPQRNFAFGANPDDLVRDRAAERFLPAPYALAVVGAMVAARLQNVIVLDRKADWYARGLLAMSLLLLSIGWLINLGGIG